MNLKSNIPDLIQKLENVKASVGGNNNGVPPIPDFSDALFSALNAGMGKMKFRIFNKGLDAEGNSLGNYHGDKTRITKSKLSIIEDDEFDERDRRKRKRVLNRALKNNPDSTYTEYEKYRLSLGRQVDYKDLEVEGSLRRSIEPARIDNKQVAIQIVNEETAKIAGYQEQQIANIRAGQNARTGTATPARIFEFSKEEFEQVEADAQAGVDQVIDRLLNEV